MSHIYYRFGFINRTPRGRIVTPKAYEHLQIPYTKRIVHRLIVCELFLLYGIIICMEQMTELNKKSIRIFRTRFIEMGVLDK